MLYLLWDLRLKVGHATRSVKECLRLGREDITIRTSLIEKRHITGDASLSETLGSTLRKQLFTSTVPEFIEAKLAERAERHRKQGGQRYVLEPNVKEGTGGLRALQTRYWIGKYMTGKPATASMVEDGLFSPDEYARFRAAETFLGTARAHLHYLTGRAMAQLTFDLQVEVADRMGYHDREGRRAVEHFMQYYCRFATHVGELTRVFLAALEDRHVKKAPLLE